MLKSLGLIETIGLTTGIAAADAAVKSANVTLVGYELAKGSGRTVIKVEGDVGAVKAAIEAACAAAVSIGAVAATKVIARPAEELESMIRNRDTVGYYVKKKIGKKPEKEPCFESESKVKEEESSAVDITTNFDEKNQDPEHEVANREIEEKIAQSEIEKKVAQPEIDEKATKSEIEEKADQPEAPEVKQIHKTEEKKALEKPKTGQKKNNQKGNKPKK